MKSLPISLLLIAMFCFTGCFKNPKITNIPGPYFLLNNVSSWSLYYDLDDAGHGRIDSVNKIGWTKKYIFAENNNQYYFINKTIDKPEYNANEIVKGPFEYEEFQRMLDSLRIKDFKFKIFLAK